MASAANRAVGITLILQDRLSVGLKGIQKSAGIVAKQGKQISFGWVGAGKAIAKTAVALSAAGFALLKFNDINTRAGAELSLTSKKLGIAVEELSVLKFIAGQSDVQLIQLTNAIKTVSEKAVANSSDFKRWGISLQDVNGKTKSGLRLFQDAAKVVSNLESSSLKAAAANQLFGESGVQLMPVLDLGQEGMEKLSRKAYALGAVTTEAAADMASDFQTEMKNASTAMGAVANRFSRKFQPMFIRLFRVIQDESSTFGDFFEGFVGIFKTGTQIITRLTSLFVQSLVAMMGIATDIWLNFKKLVNMPFDLMVRGINKVIDGLNMFRNPGNKIKKVFNSFGAVVKDTNKAIEQNAIKTGSTIVAVQKLEKAITDDTEGYKKNTKAKKDNAKGSDDIINQNNAEFRSKRDNYLKAEEIYNKSLERMVTAKQKHNKRLADLDKQYMEPFIKAREEQNKQMEQDTQLLASRVEMVSLAMGQGFADAFDAAEGGQKKMAAAFSAAAGTMLQTTLSIMEKQIVGNAAVAASEAYKSHVGVAPFIGFALAGGAASMAFAMVRLLLSKLPGMKDGGFVTGGIPNRDSVPRMLMPGEYVIPKKEVDRQMKGGGSQNGNVGMNIVLDSTLPAGKQEMNKFIRQNVVPALRSLRKQGAF